MDGITLGLIISAFIYGPIVICYVLVLAGLFSATTGKFRDENEDDSYW